jgi:diadenosine tetraphosphatase ApaH/serine/threonine PP2A family protein phosphatase
MVSVLGNHDAAVIGETETLSFNPEARTAINWTTETTTDDNKEFLRSIPKKHIIDNVTLVHGSPRDPVLEYLLDSYTATLNFSYFETPYGFFGHTHVPTIFHLNEGYADLYLPELDVKFDMQSRLLINPGSVGQPRDRDPRAAYAIYDSEEQSWHFRRVAYNVTEVQDRMRRLKLPDRHIQRLKEGW